MSFPIEDIPNLGDVFYRVHRSLTKNGEPIPGAFRDVEGAMSTDWQKYSTPEESRNRAKIPAQNGIVRLIIGDLRTTAAQQVNHAPIYPTNRAHTHVVGTKDSEVRLKLLRLFEWRIRPDDPVR